MYCSQCGANNPDNALLCNQCGKNLQSGGPPVYAQPSAIAPSSGVFVQNYLVFAILATVVCCLPAGIPAIVYAAQVNGKLAAGDIAGAQQSSKNAKLWCFISAGLGLAVAIVWGVIAFLGAISHMNR